MPLKLNYSAWTLDQNSVKLASQSYTTKLFVVSLCGQEGKKKTQQQNDPNMERKFKFFTFKCS